MADDVTSTTADGTDATTQTTRVSATERACMAARIAEDYRSRDVVVLDLTNITPIVDYFVVATLCFFPFRRSTLLAVLFPLLLASKRTSLRQPKKQHCMHPSFQGANLTIKECAPEASIAGLENDGFKTHLFN